MARYIPLDTGVVGLLCCAPGTRGLAECGTWLGHMVARKSVIVVIPDVCVYEVRRELLRLEATPQLRRLGELRKALRQARVSPAAWTRAAEFWALVRRQGIPTDTSDALDGDAILAAVATTLGQRRDTVTIATTNVGHLNRFPGVDAREWQNIP